jgi:hypothetical protein
VSSFTHAVWPAQTSHALICAHGARDVRCANCGPSLMSWAREWAAAAHAHYESSPTYNKSETIRHCVWGVSHIGGHEFAGNLILYPTGDWYGYVKERGHVHTLLTRHQYDTLPRVANHHHTNQSFVDLGLTAGTIPALGETWATQDGATTSAATPSPSLPLWRGRKSLTRDAQMQLENMFTTTS